MIWTWMRDAGIGSIMTDPPPADAPPSAGRAESGAPGALRTGSEDTTPAVDRQARFRADRDPPMMVARGLGGRLELYADRVRIVRQGYLNYFLSLLARRPTLIETTIAIEHISAFDIVHPILFNDFVYVAYPGSPPLSGHPLRDSVAENALLMNFFDNRMFYAIKRKIDALISRPAYVTVRENQRQRSNRSLAEPRQM
jgi:hypothetical protein